MLTNKGQSVIEVIVAMSIFVIIAASGVTAILGSYSSTRLAEEQSIATSIASEGIDAARAIRNQSWDALTIGNHGLSNTGGSWSFSGSSDLDSTAKFTRVVSIQQPARDPDTNLKEIVVTVTWDFTPSRKNSIQMTSLLTNWQPSTNYVN